MEQDLNRLPESDVIELAAGIVSAYVSNNTVQSSELPALIQQVQEALVKAATGAVETPKEELKPAVPVRRSVTPDHIVCLEDGKSFKSLKRHLTTEHQLTPQEYRERWGLPLEYPMVAPNYAAARSELAKSIGLGQKRKAAAAAGKRNTTSKRSPRKKAAASS